MFGQVLNQIRVNHPDSLDMHELFMAAIEGMIHAADPHSYVIPASRLEPGKESALREGKLHAGADRASSIVGGAPVVVSVAAGTAASQLDILPGDELISVDGAPVRATSAKELEIALAGRKVERTKLGFERRRADGSLAALERRVRRERVRRGVRGAGGHDARLAAPATCASRRSWARRWPTTCTPRSTGWSRQGMQRLVLDLRDNGGGSVSEAAHVAGEFLPRGSHRLHGRRAQGGGHRHGARAALVLAQRAALSDRRDGERGHRERIGARRRRAAGPRPRAHRRPADLRQVAAHARLPDVRRLGARARHRPRAHAVRPRGAARVPCISAAATTIGWRAPIATPPAARRARPTAAATVYGGGGIYPGCPSRRRSAGTAMAATSWTSSQLPLTWSGSYVDRTRSRAHVAGGLRNRGHAPRRRPRRLPCSTRRSRVSSFPPTRRRPRCSSTRWLRGWRRLAGAPKGRTVSGRARIPQFGRRARALRRADVRGSDS